MNHLELGISSRIIIILIMNRTDKSFTSMNKWFSQILYKIQIIFKINREMFFHSKDMENLPVVTNIKVYILNKIHYKNPILHCIIFESQVLTKNYYLFSGATKIYVLHKERPLKFFFNLSKKSFKKKNLQWQ